MTPEHSSTSSGEAKQCNAFALNKLCSPILFDVELSRSLSFLSPNLPFSHLYEDMACTACSRMWRIKDWLALMSSLTLLSFPPNYSSTGYLSPQCWRSTWVALTLSYSIPSSFLTYWALLFTYFIIACAWLGPPCGDWRADTRWTPCSHHGCKELQSGAVLPAFLLCIPLWRLNNLSRLFFTRQVCLSHPY